MDLHENLTPLRALIGTWRGHGSGRYPTISPFEYTEELTFTNIGKPFLAYAQRTWGPTGTLMHVETGYLRAPSPTVAEFILAQPTGQTELAEGTLETHLSGLRIVLEARVMNSATAKTVDGARREYVLTDDELTTRYGIAAAGQEMTGHLESRLSRVD